MRLLHKMPHNHSSIIIINVVWEQYYKSSDSKIEHKSMAVFSDNIS